MWKLVGWGVWWDGGGGGRQTDVMSLVCFCRTPPCSLVLRGVVKSGLKGLGRTVNTLLISCTYRLKQQARTTDRPCLPETSDTLRPLSCHLTVGGGSAPPPARRSPAARRPPRGPRWGRARPGCALPAPLQSCLTPTLTCILELLKIQLFYASWGFGSVTALRWTVDSRKEARTVIRKKRSAQ